MGGRYSPLPRSENGGGEVGKNLMVRSARSGIRKWGLEPRGGPCKGPKNFFDFLKVYENTYVVCGCRREDWYSRLHDDYHRMLR